MNHHNHGTPQDISKIIPVMMHLTDREEKITTVSDYWLQQLGYLKEDVTGKSIYEFITEESGRFNKRVVIPELEKTGFCSDVPFQFIRKDGDIVNVFLSATAEPGEDGNIGGYLNVLVDSAMNRYVEEELKLSREKLRNLFDFASDGIVIVNPESGRFLDCNVKAAKTLGYSKGELLQLSVSDLHDDMTSDEIKHVFNQQILGKTLMFETSHKRKDGSLVPVELSSTLISIGNRFVIQTFIRDITLRRKLEQEREHLILDLQKALDEIKTLKGILPFCSFCNKIRDDKGQWEQADVYIHKNTDVDITHGVCPDCMKQHYPEEYKSINQDDQI